MTAVTVALLPHETPNAVAGWTPETGQALRTTLLPAEAAARPDSGLPLQRRLVQRSDRRPEQTRGRG